MIMTLPKHSISSFLLVFTLLLAPFAKAQQNIIIEEDSIGYSSVSCPLPATGSINISGTADNFNSATDSIGLIMFWGDGTTSLDSVALVEAGTTDYFYGSFAHTYTLAGTYHQQLVAIAGNGISDTADLDSVVLHSNCILISGYVYNDINSNCSLDASDDSLAGSCIIFQHNNSTIAYGFTDNNGHFVAGVPNNLTGVTATIANSSFYWNSTCPTSGSYTFNSTTNQTFNFGLECDGGTDFRAAHAYSGVEPPGSVGVLSFYAGAKTCLSQNGVATLVLDPKVSYAGMISGPTPSTINGNTLTWNFTALPSFNYYSGGIHARMSILTDTAAEIGDTACFTVSVTADTVNPNNNSDTWCLIVDGPYDPNNKTVSSPTMEANGNTAPNSKLTYRVNFQNTGSAPAINVYILDSISEYLNFNTLEVVSNSHEMNLQYVKDRVLRFDFPEIYLPDSNANEPESHGFCDLHDRIERFGCLGNGCGKYGSYFLRLQRAYSHQYYRKHAVCCTHCARLTDHTLGKR